MNENSESFINDKSLEVWDFIEGRKNNEFNEYHLTENSQNEDEYKFQDNLSGKIKIIKNLEEKLSLSEILKINYKKEEVDYNYKFFQNGKLLKNFEKLEKIKKESVIQIFFLKKEEENKILEKKNISEKNKSGSFSISFSSEEENYFEKIENNETEEILNIQEKEFFLGFFFFENFLTYEEIIFKRYLFHLDYFLEEKFIDKNFNEEILVQRENVFLKNNPQFIFNPILFKNYFFDKKNKNLEKKKNKKFSVMKNFGNFFFGFFFYFFGFFFIYFLDIKKINYFMNLGFFLRIFLSVIFFITFESVLFSFPILFIFQKFFDFN